MRLMAFNEALVDLNKCLDIDVNYIKAYAKKGIYYTINILYLHNPQVLFLYKFFGYYYK